MIGATVVSFNLAESCGLHHVVAEQNDADLARLVLDYAVATHGENVNVGVVNDPSFFPLAKRQDIYEQYRAEFDWNQLFMVGNAAAGNVISENSLVATAALEEIPSSTAIAFLFSPYGK